MIHDSISFLNNRLETIHTDSLAMESSNTYTNLDLVGMGGEPEFLNNERTVLVFNKPILASDVMECLKKCIKAKIWAKSTRIMILSGFHTGSEGQLGASASNFTGNIYTHYERLAESCNEIEEMNYGFEFVEVKTLPDGFDSEGNMVYALAKGSLANINAKVQNVFDSDYQNILVFATCFSKKSQVNDVIDACGLYPALYLTADLGFTTEGNRFKLDLKQQEIVKHFSKV